MQEKKRTKFRKCSKCHKETTLFICCGKIILDEQKYETTKQKNKRGEFEE